MISESFLFVVEVVFFETNNLHCRHLRDWYDYRQIHAIMNGKVVVVVAIEENDRTFRNFLNKPIENTKINGVREKTFELSNEEEQMKESMMK
jgi:hypothetical protein